MSQIESPVKPSSLSIADAVSYAYNADIQLNVSREDIAFITGIHTSLEIDRTYSLAYADLENIFDIVSEISMGNRETISLRTQSAVERLLKNQLLLRVDGGGISGTPTYDITRLGKAIVGFLTENETLTRQNLTIITKRIIGILAEIRRALESSGSQRFWEEDVLLPMRHVIGELLEAVERRQSGLDKEQEEVRTQISTLLEKNWLDALEACESLLDTTSETLQELYHTLLAENTAIKQGLNEIYEQADSQGQRDVLDTIDGIYHRLDQLELWGKERVSSWSQYYRRVNDFLQSIVRFDPNREYSQKLKEGILEFPKDPWFVTVIDPQFYKTMREISFTPKKQRVARILIDHEHDDLGADDDGNLVLDLMIQQLKKHLAEAHSLDLIDVIIPYLEKYPLDRVYPHIGTLIDLMLQEAKNRPGLPPEWQIPLEDLDFKLQNLIIKPDHHKNR